MLALVQAENYWECQLLQKHLNLILILQSLEIRLTNVCSRSMLTLQKQKNICPLIIYSRTLQPLSYQQNTLVFPLEIITVCSSISPGSACPAAFSLPQQHAL